MNDMRNIAEHRKKPPVCR